MSSRRNPNDSYIVTRGAKVSAYIGPDATLFYQAAVVKASIDLYMKTGIIPVRGATLTRMLVTAAAITKPKKPYPRSVNGQQQALKDLDNWMSIMRAALPVVEAA